MYFYQWICVDQQILMFVFVLMYTFVFVKFYIIIIRTLFDYHSPSLFLAY
jgi:hypothetical protein